MNQLRLLKLFAVLLFVCTSFVAVAQDSTKAITGNVTDEATGKPIEGASVKIKNSTIGTTTDENGNFSLRAPSSESVITITYVGFKVYESKVGNTASIQIKLAPTENNMDDVVVVGYYTERKSRINSAIETVKMSEVENLPVSNIGAALTGRLLGIDVSGGDARPWSRAQMVVRNPQSITKDGGNIYPLIIIDGVIQTGTDGKSDPTMFNSLDMSEVEEITFLKDAQAAIYGARGANGVVVVTTKKGKAGKPRINYSGSYAHNDETRRTNMMSAYEQARLINIVNGPNGERRDPTDPNFFFSADELEHFKTIDHHWIDQTWKSSFNMRNAVNVSGGADRATYFVGVSHFTQDGNIGLLDFNRWNYRAGTNINVASGLKIGLQLAGSTSSTRKMNNRIGGTNEERDYMIMLKAPRYIPPYVDGYPSRLPGGTGANSVNGYHFWELQKSGNFSDDKGNSLTFNANIEYQIPFVKGLKVAATYGRSDDRGTNTQIGTNYMTYEFTGRLGEHKHIWDGATGPVARVTQNSNRLLMETKENMRDQFNMNGIYSRQFGLHSVDVFASVEKSRVIGSDFYALREAPMPTTDGQFRTAFGASDVNSNKYEGGTLGYIGRASYAYGNKYSATFLVRSDASTKFHPSNYWGTFYSAGLGWVVSEENFFKSNLINFLKVRYSLGLLGKDNTARWEWRQRFTYQQGQGGLFGTSDNTNNLNGLKMERSPNPDAKWSNDTKHNVGVDMRMLDNRLSLTAEGFYNLERNILVNLTENVPVTVGGSVAAVNYASMNFFGYEFALGWSDQFRKDFNYGIDVRFSWADNHVIRGDYSEINKRTPWQASPGQSTDIGMWGYDVLGMFRSQEEINDYLTKYNITSLLGTAAADIRPGMLYYRDVRGPLQADGTFAAPDGIIDINDQIQLKRRKDNHYNLSSTVRLGYKNIQFQAVLTGSFGGFAMYDGMSLQSNNINNLYENMPAYWSNIWDSELNPGGTLPNPFYSRVNLVESNFWSLKSTRLRVASAQLSYGLPKNILSKAKIQSASILLSMMNPFEIINPFSSYRSALGSWDTYPSLRTTSIGLNINF